MKPATRTILAFVVAFFLLGGLVDRFALDGDGVLSGVGRGEPGVEFRTELTARGGYGAYHALATHAAGADVVLDSGASTLFPIVVQGLVRPLELRQQPIPEIPSNAGLVLAADNGGRHGPWVLLRSSDPGPISVVLVRRQADRIVMADARLLPQWGGDSVRHESTSNRLFGLLDLPSPILEVIFLLALAGVGGAVLPRALGNVWLRGPLALIVGVAALAGAGLLRLSGVWPIAILIALASGGLFSARRLMVQVGFARGDLLQGSWLIIGLSIVTAVSRQSGFFWAPTIDSILYLSGAQALADGRFPLEFLDAKRGLGQQSIHAVGFALGLEGLQSLGPVLLLAACILLVQAPRIIYGERQHRSLSAFFAGLVALALIAQPTMSTWAAYANSHVLVAVLLLAVAILLQLLGQQPWNPDSSRVFLESALGVLILALVFLRGEATVLVALLLVGTLSARVSAPASAWRVLGLSTVAWNLLVMSAAVSRGSSAPITALGLVGFGFLSIFVPQVLRLLPSPVTRRLPLVVVVALWSLLIANQALMLGTDFVSLLVANLGGGIGRWGLAAPILLMLGVLAVAGRLSDSDGPGIHAARWLVAGYVPFQFLAKLGDSVVGRGSALSFRGFGNLKWDDSTNRMWTHVVLLVALLLIFRWMQQSPRPLGPIGLSSLRAGLLAAGVIWAASMWQPFYVPYAVSADAGWGQEVATGVVTNGNVVGPPLTDGVSVRQLAFVDLHEVGRGDHVSVCVDLEFVTFLRVNAGDVIVRLGLGQTSETFVIPASELKDWTSVPFCIDATGVASSTSGTLTIELEGRGAVQADAAVAPLFSSRDGLEANLIPAAVITRPGVSSRPSRERLALRVETIRAEPRPLQSQAAPLDRFMSVTLPLSLPLLVAILVIVALVGDALQGQTGHGGRLYRTGAGLLFAGLLIITVGLGPAQRDRDLIALQPESLGVQPHSDLVLSNGLRIRQVLPAVMGPRIHDLSRRERLCLAVQVWPAHGGEALTSLQALFDTEFVLSTSDGRVTRHADSESRLLAGTSGPPGAPETNGLIVGCFRVPLSDLQSAQAAAFEISAEGMLEKDELRLGARSLDSGRAAAELLGDTDVTVAMSALDVQLHRETASYRARIWRVVGGLACIGGFVLVLLTNLAQRRSRPRACVVASE